MLLQHLLLGFELGVYAPHEHCMLFWCAPRQHCMLFWCAPRQHCMLFWCARRLRRRTCARARLRPVSFQGAAAAAWGGGHLQRRLRRQACVKQDACAGALCTFLHAAR